MDRPGDIASFRSHCSVYYDIDIPVTKSNIVSSSILEVSNPKATRKAQLN